MVDAKEKMIAIKDFEMPKNCVSCPFYVSHSDDEDNCRITGEGLYDVKIGERHEKCPLLEDSEKTGHGINNGGRCDNDTIKDEFFILFFIAFLCCFLFYVTKF